VAGQGSEPTDRGIGASGGGSDPGAGRGCPEATPGTQPQALLLSARNGQGGTTFSVLHSTFLVPTTFSRPLHLVLKIGGHFWLDYLHKLWLFQPGISMQPLSRFGPFGMFAMHES
jgi:hypothetical protein